MEKNRLKLHNKLLTVCDNVYFQPPSNISLKYPCIIYHRSSIDDTYAANNVYLEAYSYLVTVIAYKQNDPIFESVKSLTNYTKFNSGYVSDNLAHINYTIKQRN